jgi:hypothetical protein
MPLQVTSHDSPISGAPPQPPPPYAEGGLVLLQPAIDMLIAVIRSFVMGLTAFGIVRTHAIMHEPDHHPHLLRH